MLEALVSWSVPNWLQVVLYFLSESALWRFFGAESQYRCLMGKINTYCCFSVAVF